MTAYPESPNHALYVGAVLGMFARAGIAVRMVDDDSGVHLAEAVIYPFPTEPNIAIPVVIPPPPAGWSFAEWLDAANAMPEPRVDRRPHSRACGIAAHPHGEQCAKDCPTCAPFG